LSRTAIWVGDPVEFVVEFSLAPSIDVLAEDLAREKIKLEGLEVVTSSNERVADADGRTTHRFRYQFTTYDVGTPALRIEGWPVRYYVRRAGQQPRDAKPVGEVRIPGAVIARRDTLPDDLPNLDLRDEGAAHEIPITLRAARSVGIGLMALAAAPLAIWGAALVHRSRSRVKRPSARTVRAHARSALDELRALDTASESGRREAYGRLDQALRKHLADTRGIPAQALCAEEVAARLQAAGSAQSEVAGELLAECERARYGPPDRLPPAERFGAALETAEQILGARS
jgi:hypothetical protein